MAVKAEEEKARRKPAALAQNVARFVEEKFDFRPGRIIKKLDLLKPIYRQTTNYGHFGKAQLSWEK